MGSIAGDELMPEVGGHEERILVSVRLRPLNTKEVTRNDVSDWECINDKTLLYRNAPTERSMYPSAYTFDRVFGCDSPTKKVYEEAAKDVALSVVSGINASIFAYGQTSSGKTYTMSGITEFAVEDIYDYVQRHDERTFVLKFSAMEIYNESVRDLLSTDNTPLRLLDDPERGTVVDKLTEETLKDLNHLKELLSVCEAQRQIGETSLNEMSSRSHQILRLTIESCAREFIGKDSSSTLAAGVDFVDLAGSERASQTLSAGTRLKEGCHINRSLLTLGTVVRKLSKGRNGHVPYRDSKLTRILQCSLGGNARTAIICTISPARSHVEQSRNTLTFASCAKEVATNAQVNVVMSDKALVKHLQRELARLEHELNGLGSSSPPCGSAALLKEKDLQIEKMENEIKELILQRDLAQARLGGLEQAGGSPSSYILAKFNQYSNIHASLTSENEPTSPCVAESHCPDVGVKRSNRFQYSNGCHEISTNEHPKENTEDPFLFDGPTPRCSTISPKFLGPDPYKGWDGNTQGCEDDFEELCKDVRCIEMEESSTNRIRVSNNLTCEEDEGKLPLILSKVGITTNQTCLLAPQKENEELNNVSAERMYGAIEQKYQNVPQAISPVDSSFSDEPSHCCVTQDLSSPRSLNQDSSSCSVNLMTDLSFPLNRKVDNDVNTPRSMTEQNFTGSPQDTESNLSTLRCASKSVCLSRENSLTSQRSDMTDELKAHKVKNHADDDVTSINSFVSELKEVTKYQCENKHIEHQKNGPKMGGSERILKDVGLDPMHDSPESPSNWLLEFESKRREIIELWQTCHVSLVHRTYFFLLFTGDPSDSIYMEVECRRLFFLKDLHSRGKYDKLPTEATRDLTPASSMKALRREREMLSKQMQKKLSDKERTKLYEKWDIRINSKRRRLQLAQRLWTDTKDMNHIAESANLVAKLVGLQEPSQGMKEMFILSFTPQKASRRSYSWRSTA